MSIPSEPSRRPRVLALVVTRRGDDVAGVLNSIDAQVYGLEDVMVVADHPLGDTEASPPPKRVRSMAQALTLVGDEVEYLWILDSRTTARPDALEALVSTAGQVDASVVGSKVLDAADPRQLLSVGGATDVFGFPYTGLDRGEIDQEQFDVIRDVAYVDPASMLVRRDLAEGLGGLDYKLPYVATGLDLCQRARVVGGRVVVAPTSEVLNRASEEDRVHTWREQAGRVRVMIKTYSLVTLMWAIPGVFLFGLLSSLYRTARGSWPSLLRWVGAWLWNLRHLPSTMSARRRAPAVSMASDAELFRFQVRGSVELRAMASDLGALLGSGTDQEDDDEVYDASPAFWQRPAVITALLGIGFVLVMTRSILVDGLPVTGFVLPLADSAWDTLRAYAGGWHLGGLGSSEPMHPSVGATAAVRLLLGNRGAAAAILTVGSVASGLAGMVALVRIAGLGRAARLVSGAVFVAGLPMLVLAGEGYWPGLLAMGGLPWAWAGIVSPAPSGVTGWIGRLARIGLATAWSAMFVPAAHPGAARFRFGLGAGGPQQIMSAHRPGRLHTGLTGTVPLASDPGSRHAGDEWPAVPHRSGLVGRDTHTGGGSGRGPLRSRATDDRCSGRPDHRIRRFLRGPVREPGGGPRVDCGRTPDGSPWGGIGRGRGLGRPFHTRVGRIDPSPVGPCRDGGRGVGGVLNPGCATGGPDGLAGRPVRGAGVRGEPGRRTRRRPDPDCRAR